MNIDSYNEKRDFKRTPEPKGKAKPGIDKLRQFVVQEHYASHHHFDFRLEIDGVLKSWAVPKGPSLKTGEKRLAVHVEDHPIEYGSFEGHIPKEEYGGGEVILWDKGTYKVDGDPNEQYKNGKLELVLEGKKLKGRWVLVRTRMGGAKNQRNWLLMKKNDRFATGEDIVHTRPNSVKKRTKKTLKISPQLAMAQKTPPVSEDYVHEIKFDGYRTFAKLENGEATLFSRSGKDWTERYPLLAAALSKRPDLNALVDGEVVCLNDKGVSSFEGLQAALKQGEHSSIYYYIYDILYLNGKDQRSRPLLTRKKKVEKFVKTLDSKRIRYSEHFEASGAEALHEFCSNGLEGMVSKLRSSPYQSGRGPSWIKTKCQNRDDFVVLGFQKRKNSQNEIGSLVLGVPAPDGYRQAGKVGTGFDRRERKDLYLKLKGEPPGKLVVEVEYTEFTKEGKLRHPVFKGIREDKTAEEVVDPFSPLPIKHMPVYGKALLVDEITSPEKLLFPRAKITKLDLANYYNNIYEFMAPHLNDKILNLVKCPKGVGGECFYNKHVGNMKNINTVEVERKGKRDRFIFVKGKLGLIYLVRYNTLEIHTWNAKAQSYNLPDELILDLDPDKGLAPKVVIDGAFEIKEVLKKIGLTAYPKSTGGKGVHLHIPLLPGQEHELVHHFSRSIAYLLEEINPDKYTANIRLKNRKEKIFIDYMRNSFGSSYICPFSTRAKEGAPVAMPLSWRELKTFDPADPVTLLHLEKKLKGNFKHPWIDYRDNAQQLPFLH